MKKVILIEQEHFASFRNETSPQEIHMTINDKSGKSWQNLEGSKHLIETGKRDEQISHHSKDAMMQGNSVSSFLFDEKILTRNRTPLKIESTLDQELSIALSQRGLEGTS